MTADAPSAIRLVGLSKAFGSLTVLDDVTLDVRGGHALCILGRSGTGKSVTLKSIVGLIRPDHGEVYVGDDEITGLDSRGLSRVRRNIGFLFQNSALFDSISVGENVAFPLRRHTDLSPGEIEQKARAKLAAVGLEQDYAKMPAELSGGMRKRAALARAMALDPPILLADEPSAGLDPITAEEIDLLLVRTKEAGATLVVVTHNIPSARTIADELAFLHEGRVLARGTVEDLDRSEEPLVKQFMRSESGG